MAAHCAGRLFAKGGSNAARAAARQAAVDAARAAEAAKTGEAAKAAKAGTAGGERAGKSLTPAGKREVWGDNAATHGEPVCETCARPVDKPLQSQKGVTPPGTEGHVDHIIPKSKGGDGAPSNGQLLRRDCNLKKSDN